VSCPVFHLDSGFLILPSFVCGGKSEYYQLEKITQTQKFTLDEVNVMYTVIVLLTNYDNLFLGIGYEHFFSGNFL
jgi:hypothetical protein